MGFLVVLGLGVVLSSVFLFLDWQQTVPDSHLASLSSLDGSLQKDSMIWGMHTPGHLSFLGLGVVVVVLDGEFLFLRLFRQHLERKRLCLRSSLH